MNGKENWPKSPQTRLKELKAMKELSDEEKKEYSALCKMKREYDLSDEKSRERTSTLFGKKRIGLFYDPKGKPCSMWDWSGYTHDYETKIVARDFINGFRISTVYLGVNMSIFAGNPIIFETMIFDDTDQKRETFDDYQERYTTREQAIEGHKKACKEVKRLIKKL